MNTSRSTLTPNAIAQYIASTDTLLIGIFHDEEVKNSLCSRELRFESE